MYTEGVKVLKTSIGLIANISNLIDPSRFYLLETNFNQVEEIEFTESMDSYFYLFNQEGINPSVQLEGNRVAITGDISRVEEDVSDRRYTLFGNLGLFSRYVLCLLESKYDIYNPHSAGLYDPKSEEFILVSGGAGSGKTCFLLRAIEEGMEIFNTEFAHVEIKPDSPPVFYKGALRDNIRVGNLKYDYPEAKERLGIELPQVEDEWGEQMWNVDLSEFQTDFDRIEDPKLKVVFPHIERNWEGVLKQKLSDTTKLKKNLFDNISEKVALPFILGDEIALPGLNFDSNDQRRFKALDHFVKQANIQKAISLTGGTSINLKEVIK